MLHRRALLEASFKDDNEAIEKRRGNASNYVVRPGRLLTCIAAMEGDLSQRGEPANEPILRRLEEIRREALDVLQDIAYE
jgi:hypothetical protein